MARMMSEPTASTVSRVPRPDSARVQSHSRAQSWAALLHRAFPIDVLGLSRVWEVGCCGSARCTIRRLPKILVQGRFRSPAPPRPAS
jgi:hypothetical protein